MDHKAWLWRKKSSEKTIVATNKFDVSVKGNGEETQNLTVGDEGKPVRPVTQLNEKLASVLLDCQAKDDLVTKHEKMAKEAIAAREKAEAEVVCLKGELEEARRHEEAANDRLAQTDAALKKCIQQLNFFREQQEQKVHDAVKKASSEFEKAQKVLEEKLIETSKRLTNVAIENTNLSNALIVKEKLVEELHKHASQTVADFNALMSRLDSTEKENAFLKYEFHMLEKELQVRNEELEYNRRSAETSHRQHLESVRKVTKLEAECQRLRLLMRKRLTGPTALAKMKSEVEIWGRDPPELRRNPNPTRDLILRDTTMQGSSDIPVKNVNFLIEQLRGMEEENKSLKEIMAKKNAELQSSQIMFSRTASRLSQLELQLTELSETNRSMELAKCSPVSNELQSPTAGFDIGSDDGRSSSGSRANALISELEHFRGDKLKSPSELRKAAEMHLMDDFVEMEKLALVSVQTPSASDKRHLTAGKELVPCSESTNNKQDSHAQNVATEQSFDWLQVVLSAIYKQQRYSKRSLADLHEDIKIALGYANHPNSREADVSTTERHHTNPEISGYITWKSPKTSPIMDSLEESSSTDSPLKEISKEDGQSNLSKSIRKLIQLIEGINVAPVLDDGSVETCSPALAAADYFIRVFEWRSSELNTLLQQFVKTCKGLLNGKVGFESFAEELWSTLDWIVGNCVTPKDDSRARDKIKRHFSWNGLKSENGVGHLVDCDPIGMSKEHSSVDSSNGKNIPVKVQNSQCTLQEENKRLKNELNMMESAKRETESRLLSAADKIESLMMQFRESQKSIDLLQAEAETLKESKGMIEEQMENQKSINEDLDTQLTVTKAKLNEALQKFSSLEIELEDRNSCCEELEATCLELQLQLESLARKEPVNCGIDAEGKQSQNGWEIAAASVKLAECQDTILNLGKQLKALATPREAALFDKVFNTTSSTTTAANFRNLNRHFSLRDQMIAEDRSKAIILRSPIEEAVKTSEDHPDNDYSLSAPTAMVCTSERYCDIKQQKGNNLAIVPVKRQGVGLLRWLLIRRKKGGSRKSKP